MAQTIFTTKEMALELGMNGKQLRRYLRKLEKYNDGIYTRYAWTKKEYDAIVKKVKQAIDNKQVKKESMDTIEK